MAYSSWSVSFNEQPSAAKWNILGTNDASFNDGTGIGASAITPEKLLTGTGTSWAWQSWTPTYTNLTVGNGTVTAKYCQIGKTVTFSMKLLFGSTTSISSTPVSFTFPVTAKDSYSDQESICWGTARDSSGYGYPLIVAYKSTTSAQLYTPSGGTTYAFISSTTPFTWATNDYIAFVGAYEAA